MESKKVIQIKDLVAHVERNHGKGSIVRLGDRTMAHMDMVPTGVLTLDQALGGGFPKGRIVEIFGPESSGKTTTALRVISEVQVQGGVGAFIDVEHGLDPRWARKLGVNTEELLVSQPDTGEQALDIVQLLVESNSVHVIVVDSVAALVPKAEIDGDMGESHIGLQARLMSQAMRKLAGPVSKHNVLVIFINQLREKIGVMFGSPEVTTGGRALKFYASVRVDLRKIDSVKDRTDIIGSRIRAKVVKNKCAVPFKTAEFSILFKSGISREASVIEAGLAAGILTRAHASAPIVFGEAVIGRGLDAARDLLVANQDLSGEITAAVVGAVTSRPEDIEARRSA